MRRLLSGLLSAASLLAVLEAQPVAGPGLNSIRPLTRGFTSDHSVVPCFSPDGAKIAFNGRCSTDKRDALYLIRPDGAGLEQAYCGDSPVFYPAWSPDGASICFNAGTSLYEYNVNTGRTSRLLTDAAKWSATPVYTRDSRKIVYRSPYGLRSYSRSSQLSARLTSKPADRQPAVNPNTREIALMSNNDEGAARLYLIQADGSKRKEITPHRGSFAHPAWSPDGKLLLYDRTVNQRCNLYVVDRRTGLETRLTSEDSAAARFGCFAPSAKTIVFVRQDRGGQNLFIGDFQFPPPGPHSLSPDTLPPTPAPQPPPSDTQPPATDLRPPLSDTTRPGDSIPHSAIRSPQSSDDSLDRSRYKIVIFSDDDALAEEFMSLLRDKGYTSPESYVAPSPNARATIKHNDAPDEIVEELSELVNLHLNLQLEPVTDPQIPETSIYINLP